MQVTARLSPPDPIHLQRLRLPRSAGRHADQLPGDLGGAGGASSLPR
ncbi:MAG: hypothetical protein M0C28_17340 [Candidatus Moduliflexus flocculans]|nr:hypothetical protein [Candidatus Moduliflexus flocculans]